MLILSKVSFLPRKSHNNIAIKLRTPNKKAGLKCKEGKLILER